MIEGCLRRRVCDVPWLDDANAMLAGATLRATLKIITCVNRPHRKWMHNLYGRTLMGVRSPWAIGDLLYLGEANDIAIGNRIDLFVKVLRASRSQRCANNGAPRVPNSSVTATKCMWTKVVQDNSISLDRGLPVNLDAERYLL
jgi:hypothetical protein